MYRKSSRQLDHGALVRMCAGYYSHVHSNSSLPTKTYILSTGEIIRLVKHARYLNVNGMLTLWSWYWNQMCKVPLQWHMNELPFRRSGWEWMMLWDVLFVCSAVDCDKMHLFRETKVTPGWLNISGLSAALYCLLHNNDLWSTHCFYIRLFLFSVMLD